MKEKKKKICKSSFWRSLWRLLAISHRRIRKLVFIIIFIEIFALIGPYISKLVIDKLTNFSTEDVNSMLALIALFFVSHQVLSIIYYFKDKSIFRVIMSVEYYLPVMANKKLVFLTLGYHEKENTGNKIIKIERGVSKVSELIVNMSWEVIPTIVQLVITLGVLFFINWMFGVSFLIFVPAFIFLTYRANKKLYPVRKERHKKYEAAYGKMGQTILNINAVQSFVQEEREVREYASIKKDIRDKELKEWFVLLGFGIGRNFIIDSGRTVILLLSAYLVWTNGITIGTLVFVITLTEKAYHSLFRLSRFYDKVEEGAEAVNRFVSLIDQESLVENIKKGFKPKDIQGDVEFKKVNFKYDGGRIALNNVSFKIESGKTTALVGPSGGGKTTVIRMLYRHYDPNRGEILLDGKNLKDYDLYSFRKFMSIVPQEVEIFDISVRDNIAYAVPNASETEIIKAAKIANAHEFVKGLSEGYDTLVGERGVKLSGGQRQRLGIARAILANPRILIFDEATSNLDSYSERLIQDAMEKISKDRTIIIIAHRLSTIRKADKIVVLEKGFIVEEGSHDELSKVDGGLYAKLLSLQRMGELD